MASGRERQGFACGMALLARLVLAVSAEASPKTTHTHYPSGLPCHAEGMCQCGFDLKPYVLIFLPAAVFQQRQLEVLMVLNSPVSFQFASDHISPS